jgi:uncharacterized protein (TIGR02246 family)
VTAPSHTSPQTLDSGLLYHAVIDAWNARNASRFAALFFDHAQLTGFDGSMLEGRADIESTFARMFRDNYTPSYVGKVRTAIRLTEDVVLIRAVAGMVPPGERDIDPQLNTVQSLVAVRRDGEWRVASFTNTPASFNDRPAESDNLTAELRALAGAQASAARVGKR